MHILYVMASLKCLEKYIKPELAIAVCDFIPV